MNLSWVSPQRFFQLCEDCRADMTRNHRMMVFRMCERWESEGYGDRANLWGIGTEASFALIKHGWQCSLSEPVTLIG